MKRALVIVLPLVLCLPGLAAAAGKCQISSLKGQYVFTGSGFTRPPTSAPGTPWVPKAIIEVVEFNGDGTLTTPAVAIANPFGDTGMVNVPQAGGAPGLYTIDEDCNGTVHFLDANNVTYRVHTVPGGETIWMIQTNPMNNVFQGNATRVP